MILPIGDAHSWCPQVMQLEVVHTALLFQLNLSHSPSLLFMHLAYGSMHSSFQINTLSLTQMGSLKYADRM